MFSNNKFIGSVFMVAGCAMGAGCLALPMLSAGPNFMFSSIFLILTGVLSYVIATLSLEIYLVYKNDVNTSSIVHNNFGHVGVVVSALVNGGLMYAILSVYMTGGADLLGKTVFPAIGLNLSPRLALILFLVVFLPIFFKGSDLVVKSNNVVFSIKVVSFLVAVFFGVAFVSPRIFNVDFTQSKYVVRALPVFLTALWFHFLIPVIAKINKYDRKECRKIFAYGIAIPVVLYILWIGVMLSLIPRDGDGHTFFMLLSNHESVGTMINFATHNNPNIPHIMKLAINLFSNVAMLTSFLTVGISTYDYIRDAFKIKQTTSGVWVNLALTMAPPAFFALFYPNGFVFILQQAAILLMVVNIIVLSCCLKEHHRLEVAPSKALLTGIIGIILILILLQVLDNFNLLPVFAS